CPTCRNSPCWAARTSPASSSASSRTTTRVSPPLISPGTPPHPQTRTRTRRPHRTRLTDGGSTRCTQLKSDELLVECFSRMPFLQNLKLAKLRKLSDRVLDCIGDHLAGVLCGLDIRLCSSITEGALIRSVSLLSFPF